MDRPRRRDIKSRTVKCLKFRFDFRRIVFDATITGNGLERLSSNEVLRISAVEDSNGGTIRAIQNHVSEIRACQGGSCEIRRREIRANQLRTQHGCRSGVRAQQVRFDEACTVEYGLRRICLREIGASEVGTPKICHRQICLGEICPS